MGVSERVTRWADVIERAVEDVGAVELELGTMLALVATESSGDPDVVNRFGFVGLFQIGTPYLKDARAWLKKHRPELLREVPRTKRGLIGNARASAIVTAAYMRKYASRHKWEPHRIAAIHKGGAGAARKVLEVEDERDLSMREAVRWVANNWRRTKGSRKGELILGSSFYDYVYSSRHFDGHLDDYDAWARERESARDVAWVEEGDRVVGVAPPPEPVDHTPPAPAVVWGRWLTSIWREISKGGGS